MAKYAAMSQWEFSSTLSEMCPVMSKLQFSLALTNFPFASFSLLADYSSIKLTSEASFHLSRAAETVKFLLDNNTLSNKRLQWQITNKSCELHYVKLDQDTLLLSQIGCIICLPNAIIKANIINWCKQMTRGIPAAGFYTMAYGFGIKK